MNVYNFKKIEKCYVFGNIDRNMDRFIKTLTSNISKFKKEEHPKEIERQERLKKREAEGLAHGGLGVGLGLHNPYDAHLQQRRANRRDGGMRLDPSPFATWDVSSSYNKSCGKELDSSYNDSVIIVSGNCGIGNKSKKYYEETFGKLDKVLGDNNCFVLFVRGNNDNPSIFNNREIDFEHIKAVPDYSVVSMKTFNCLCIGGSVSMDKEWKLAQEELYGKKLYWEDEAPKYDEKQLKEILEAYNINCIVTSTCPSFAYPGTNAFKKSKWFYRDKKIVSEFSNKGKIMDKIYEQIMDSESKPYMWIYGRFKMSNTSKLNDIVFCSLSSYGMIQVNSQLNAFFGIDTSKTLENNGHTFDHILSEELNGIRSIHHNIEDDDIEIGEPELEDDMEMGEEDIPDEEVNDGVEEEVAAPIENVGIAATATANTVITNEATREAIDRMVQEMRAADNRTYADYATLYGNLNNLARENNEIYTVRAQQPYEGIRAVTLEDIDRVATFIGNGTRNG